MHAKCFAHSACCIDRQIMAMPPITTQNHNRSRGFIASAGVHLHLSCMLCSQRWAYLASISLTSSPCCYLDLAMPCSHRILIDHIQANVKLLTAKLPLSRLLSVSPNYSYACILEFFSKLFMPTLFLFLAPAPHLKYAHVVIQFT